MPASRPYWKGYFKLSLVCSPIALDTAASTERVSFRQVNKKAGNHQRRRLAPDVLLHACQTEECRVWPTARMTLS